MAQTKSQKILTRLGTYGFIPYFSQVEQVAEQPNALVLPKAEPVTLHSLLGRWVYVFYVLLAILVFTVLIKIMRHPKGNRS